MHIAYVVTTILAAVANGYAASLNFGGAESVKVVADRVRVSQKWMIPFGVLLASGAVGLLIGFAAPVLGTAAGIGLVLYFPAPSARTFGCATPGSLGRSPSCSWAPPP
jgi:DoxX-like family